MRANRYLKRADGDAAREARQQTHTKRAKRAERRKAPSVQRRSAISKSFARSPRQPRERMRERQRGRAGHGERRERCALGLGWQRRRSPLTHALLQREGDEASRQRRPRRCKSARHAECGSAPRTRPGYALHLVVGQGRLYALYMDRIDWLSQILS